MQKHALFNTDLSVPFLTATFIISADIFGQALPCGGSVFREKEPVSVLAMVDALNSSHPHVKIIV